MARTIAVAIPKGGVGKTTTAVNLAASLAFSERRTLLIDMDTSGAAGLALGLTEANSKAGVYDIFNFISGINTAIHKTEIPTLDVVPANVHTLLREERLMKLADNRLILKNSLRSITRDYDYIIIDCPPFLRGLTTNALTASDSVLVPVKPGHFALDAVDKFFKYIDWVREVANKMIQIEGIVVTMYETGSRATEITMRELQSKYRRHLCETIIPRHAALAEACFYGKPAILYNINSPGAVAYLDLAREIAGDQIPFEQRHIVDESVQAISQQA
ncbi:MAG: ParA family protein [Ignavibacteriae bacterium]|nr:ParA family protein [Ignavibacteriota bacterium]